jgi:hypothetical protein
MFPVCVVGTDFLTEYVKLLRMFREGTGSVTVE